MTLNEIIAQARRQLAAEYFQDAIQAEAQSGEYLPDLNIAATLENLTLPIRLKLPNETIIDSAEAIIDYAMGYTPYAGVRATLFFGEVFMTEGDAFSKDNYLFLATIGTIRNTYRDELRKTSS